MAYAVEPLNTFISMSVQELILMKSLQIKYTFKKPLERKFKSMELKQKNHHDLSVGGAPIEVLKKYIEQQSGPEGVL